MVESDDEEEEDKPKEKATKSKKKVSDTIWMKLSLITKLLWSWDLFLCVFFQRS